ncbi:uncharacterized protein LOC106722702 [Alligator sinensis]|uniref:Uncharacterized protein LOC106722702 n=1 Tax=Alligator sinensis TaxID=38654 RepID=A0A3Q0HD73_ALLSI|nr:uncharacterized protein LOC106722702 [Alligator sinensis]
MHLQAPEIPWSSLGLLCLCFSRRLQRCKVNTLAFSLCGWSQRLVSQEYKSKLQDTIFLERVGNLRQQDYATRSQILNPPLLILPPTHKIKPKLKESFSLASSAEVSERNSSEVLSTASDCMQKKMYQLPGKMNSRNTKKSLLREYKEVFSFTEVRVTIPGSTPDTLEPVFIMTSQLTREDLAGTWIWTVYYVRYKLTPKPDVVMENPIAFPKEDGC